MSDHQSGAGQQQQQQQFQFNAPTTAATTAAAAAAVGSNSNSSPIRIQQQQQPSNAHANSPSRSQYILSSQVLPSYPTSQGDNTSPRIVISSQRVNILPNRTSDLPTSSVNNTTTNHGTGANETKASSSQQPQPLPQQQMAGHPLPSAINASTHPTLVSSLSSPPRQRPASVSGQLLNSSPQQTVRTSNPSIVNTLSTPPLQSHSSNRNCKNVSLKELHERPAINDEIAAKRRKILDYKMDKVQKIQKHYAENASELFFLNAGGNLIDYFGWRKRCINTSQFLLHLRSCRLDPENDDEDLTIFLRPPATTSSNTTSTLSSQLQLTASPDLNLKSASTGGQSSHTTSTSLATQNALNSEIISTQNLTPDVTSTSKSTIMTVASTAAMIAATSVDKTTNVPSTSTSNTTTSATSTITSSTPKSPIKLPSLPPLARQHTRQHSISAVYETSIGSQEQIAEKAKQEAYVIQRIAELQREGLWSERRLPKVQEPPRAKAHWDYLMEEMVWLAADFAQERKWKKAAAKKCARNVQKYFQEKAIQAQKAEKTQELRLKRIASFIAKEVKQFWGKAEKFVEHKHQARLDEKRQQAGLSFILHQTEKYSSWLTEGMNKSQQEITQSVTPSANSSRVSSPTNRQKLVTSNSDDEFKPTQSSSDDEETIAKAEADMGTQVTDEIEMLKRESELPIEDLLDLLPDSYLEAAARQDPLPDSIANSEEEEEEPEQDSEMDTSALAKTTTKGTEEDEEYAANDDEINSTDDEETIQREEQQEANEQLDHDKEIADLEADNELTIEELKAKYSAAGPSDSLPLVEDMDVDLDEDEEGGEDEESEMDIDEDEDEENEKEEAEDEEMGLESLLEDTSEKVDDNEKANKEITDVAALAESIQPKGSTLSSTSVVTPVPFLLKHSLREYQHIGLDWLVTMFDRKLNGILADEMGLGKTIQTISLLAHLACEKENWGPHLIIVPTSVMLNWEMELKKWCPAFKILTYYGTQKERKQKRTGWTKPNAFHVCITSYKLVIQDHQSFRRKKWKYLILDEAQNIKNFKSQRWQLLLNFQTQRRLLLTGTPLQNNLMELWSLMHFLMPHVFQSHREFKEWFSNPVTGMIEGNSEYNESIIKRLHKVLRPFLLRRLKSEVEKQLPKKYEHVVMCRLSKRQRFLYDDFMSRAKTKETLATGNLLSVINVLMQLRKVCNHPNLFEVRPILAPFQMEGLDLHIPSAIFSALEYDPFKQISLETLNLHLINLELSVSAFTAHRVSRLKAPRRLIEELDSVPNPPPPCPKGQINVHVQHPLLSTSSSSNSPMAALKGVLGQHQNSTVRVGTSPRVKTLITNPSLQGNKNTLQIVQPQPATPKSNKNTLQIVQTQSATPKSGNKNTLQIVQPQQATSLKTLSVTTNYVGGPRYAQLVQTSSGKHILVTSSTPSVSNAGQRVAVLSKSMSFTTTNRPLVRVVNATAPPQSTSVNATSSLTETKTSTSLTQPVLAALVHQSQTSTRPTPSSRAKREEKGESIYKQMELEEMRARRRKEQLASIAARNQRRCSDWPVYGSDLRESCQSIITNSTMTSAFPSERKSAVNSWRLGYTHCINAQRNSHHPSFFWTQTDALADSILSIQDRVDQLKNIFSRFVLYVPAVSSPQPRLHSSHPPPSKVNHIRAQRSIVRRELASICTTLHPITSAMLTQFPEPRLIQYDCGKLQTLDSLLRRLKTGHHRVLIFTQMTRMLDVLEAFLTFHGHIYLRLDGTTRVDQRQMLMERFNADKRIFCFILSTRSGGIGVNLTGADTVIFYDSDWNPTMDAQAQDRCHRIGQTRDVHIYRLVSEMTVEENILKKANQKRLLGDLAIEGGNFTTVYFKSTTIQDLFNINVGENDASKRMADVLERSSSQRKLSSDTPTPNSPQTTCTLTPVEDQKAALGALESALAAAEDEWDVQATRTAKAEAAAELAEFDEDIPLEDAADNSTIEPPEISKAEQEFQKIAQQLLPIERYAVRVVEETEATEEHLAAAEAKLEQQKREWELERIQTQRDDEKRRAGLDEEESAENLVTFSREDAQNQVWVSDNAREQMPMWCPPTPPQDEKDVYYVDHALGFLYESTVMSEAQLPPVYVHREHNKRKRMDVAPNLNRGDNRRAIKSHFKDYHKDEASVIAAAHMPRSLFDRPTPTILKCRRDLKLHKFRGIMRTGPGNPAMMFGLPPSLQQLHGLRTTLMTNKPSNTEIEGQPEWLIFEDYALLQAVQNVQELPLNLMVLSPGHTPNWDLIAEMVNNNSRCYRSPKFCKHRYDNVIVPREEGRLVYDPAAKPRQKKSKLLDGSAGGPLHGAVLPSAPKQTRGLRTAQLYHQDNNRSFTMLLMQRFGAIRTVGNKRIPTAKPLLVNPNLKNPKHAAVLSDHGINYDAPFNPIEVATRRAERILQEKNKNSQEIALNLSQAQNKQSSTPSSSSPATPTPSSSGTTPSSIVGSSMVSGTNIKAAVPTVAPAPVILPVAISSNKLSSTPVRTATPPVSTPIIQQATASATAASASTTSASGAGSIGSGPQTMVVASPVVSVSQPGRATRPVATLTVQDMVRGNPTVVSVGGLSTAQVQVAANRLTTATLAQSQAGVSTVVSKVGGTVTTKQLNPAQLQYYRQQALIRQTLRNQQIKQLQVQSGQVTGASTLNPGQKMTTAVAGAPAGTLAVTAVQVSTAGGQPRTQYIKQTAGGKQITRAVSESEMSAILKRQIVAQKAAVAAAAAAAAGSGGSSAVNAGATGAGAGTATVQLATGQQQVTQVQTGLSSAHLLAQAGLQVRVQPAGQGQGQVATLVKAVGSSSGQPPSLTIPVSGMTIPHQGIKATLTNASPGTVKVKTTHQQFRQLTLQHHQQQLLQRKMAAAAAASNAVSVATANVTNTGQITKTATGKPTQLIVQTTNKAMPTAVTVQQIQQVIKHVQPQQMQHIVTTGGQVTGMTSSSPGVVLAKASGQPGGAGTTTRVIPVSVSTQGQGGQQLKQTIQVVATSGRTDASGRTPTAIKVASSVSSSQQQAILSQVSAALQGQPITFRQRTAGSSAPLMAVTVQQAPVQHSAAVLAAAAAAAGTGQQQQQQQQHQQQQQQLNQAGAGSDNKTNSNK